MKWLIRKIARYCARQFLEALYEVADEMSQIETIPATVRRVRDGRKDPRIKHD